VRVEVGHGILSPYRIEYREEDGKRYTSTTMGEKVQIQKAQSYHKAGEIQALCHLQAHMTRWHWRWYPCHYLSLHARRCVVIGFTTTLECVAVEG